MFGAGGPAPAPEHRDDHRAEKGLTRPGAERHDMAAEVEEKLCPFGPAARATRTVGDGSSTAFPRTDNVAPNTSE